MILIIFGEKIWGEIIYLLEGTCLIPICLACFSKDWLT